MVIGGLCRPRDADQPCMLYFNMPSSQFSKNMSRAPSTYKVGDWVEAKTASRPIQGKEGHEDVIEFCEVQGIVSPGTSLEAFTLRTEAGVSFEDFPARDCVPCRPLQEARIKGRMADRALSIAIIELGAADLGADYSATPQQAERYEKAKLAYDQALRDVGAARVDFINKGGQDDVVNDRSNQVPLVSKSEMFTTLKKIAEYDASEKSGRVDEWEESRAFIECKELARSVVEKSAQMEDKTVAGNSLYLLACVHDKYTGHETFHACACLDDEDFYQRTGTKRLSGSPASDMADSYNGERYEVGVIQSNSLPRALIIIADRLHVKSVDDAALALVMADPGAVHMLMPELKLKLDPALNMANRSDEALRNLQSIGRVVEQSIVYDHSKPVAHVLRPPTREEFNVVAFEQAKAPRRPHSAILQER